MSLFGTLDIDIMGHVTIGFSISGFPYVLDLNSLLSTVVKIWLKTTRTAMQQQVLDEATNQSNNQLQARG